MSREKRAKSKEQKQTRLKQTYEKNIGERVKEQGLRNEQRTKEEERAMSKHQNLKGDSKKKIKTVSYC